LENRASAGLELIPMAMAAAATVALFSKPQANSKSAAQSLTQMSRQADTVRTSF
jgi:hypothetical protein